ncbi:hypothetical protein FHS31_003120 [Sphingomonas vulcanisoli]|uniref:Multidrug transporter n=1 Tax=Sphingomonas vulcanisoli TaxID=1658060 RepID=A0ABX0TVC5_9SPHN|nr:SapC family protein [Sphingomonas vulcanisoli]NIJ09487.1 hypothetical protein [Sphingomonas vulcanisoli]
MASAPQNNPLPILYKELTPLSTQEHGGWKAHQAPDWGIIKGHHAFPITVEEFIMASQRHPIVFTDDDVPLALFGLNEGVNVFIDDANQMINEPYLPAYVRRYPFMLVQVQPNSEELTLCFDPQSNLIGDFEDGVPLIENGEATQPLKDTLAFCESFQNSVGQTGQFMGELKELGLLMDGEIKIDQPGEPQPFIYRGFKIVDEAKLKDLRGDQLRKMMQNGMLPLLHAHLFSLTHIPVLFNRQYTSGAMPKADG